MSKQRTSFGARFAGGLLRLQGHLPLAFHRWWGRRIAWLLRDVLHYRREVVMTNLSRSFPQKSYEELLAISKRFYLHLATVFTEMIWFGACRGPKGRARLHNSHMVEITNPEEFNRLYAGARQIMILQAHTGNWELTGGYLEYCYNTPVDIDPTAIAVTYRSISNKTWDAVMAQNRPAPVLDMGFDGYVETNDVLRFILERKDQKFAYTFITDQYPYNLLGSEITFMHQSTKTLVAAAKMAVKLDMALVYQRFECREEGGYRMTFVPIAEHAGGQDPLALMQQYYKLLEEDLEKQPWNYLWTHKRWKKK
jgi:KDO2-lipid IV(A) lauroyltransferase